MFNYDEMPFIQHCIGKSDVVIYGRHECIIFNGEYYVYYILYSITVYCYIAALESLCASCKVIVIILY